MGEESLAPLIEFIGKKFDQVDQRFEGIERRLDQMATKDELEAKLAETRRHTGVLVEAVRGEVRQVAEGVVNLNEKLDREMTALRQEMRTEFGEVKSMLKFSYAELDRRIRSLEEGFGALQARIGAVETRQS